MSFVHLMGIGGTGMTSLAGMFVERGWKVRGSDQKVYPPASDVLGDLGVRILEGYAAKNLEPRPDLVVVGNVISRNNPEAQALLGSDIPYQSMPEALRELFAKEKRRIAVTGTHGKSTTTSLLSWILYESKKSPSFFVGGIPANFGRGYHLDSGDPFVIEGDEYDTAFYEKTPKFLHYEPRDIIVTSIEFDHADIYRDLDHVVEQFRLLMEIVPKNGWIVSCGDSNIVQEVCSKRSSKYSITYGMSSGNDYHAKKPTYRSDGTSFVVRKEGHDLGEINSPLIGEHNVLNTLASVAMGEALGLSFDDISRAIPLFKGFRRRQEFLGEYGGIRLYDDFAHHPTAIEKTLCAFRPIVKEAGGRLWAVLEPRSNTLRRKIFQSVLPKALSPANEVLLAPVFQKSDSLPEHERLNPFEVAQSISEQGGRARIGESYDELVSILKDELQSGDVVVFMSNGNFGGVPKKLIKLF